MAKCKQCGNEYSPSFWDTTKICPKCKEEHKKEDAAFLGLLAESTPRFFITPIILVLNMLVFVVMVVSGVSFLDPTIEQLLAWGANFGPLTVNQEWWRLVSSMFIHIGVLHIVFNMWCFWNLGKLAERMFGNWTFLMLYVLSGLGGSVASLWWHPKVVSAGASGAIFGVAGGLIAFLYLGKLQVPRTLIKQNLKSVLVFVAYSLSYGLQESGIDNAAHLGGLVTGLLIGAFLHRPLPASEPSPRTRYYLVFSVVALSLILGAGSAKNQVANDPGGRFVAGNKLLKAGEFDQAIAEYQKALELKPDFFPAHFNLGLAYTTKGLYDEAIASYKEALDLKPDDAKTHYFLGDAYSEKGLHDAAITSYKTALEINPKDMDGYKKLSRAYRAKGLYDEAIASYEKALELRPDDAEARSLLANIYTEKEFYDDAIGSGSTESLPSVDEILDKYVQAIGGRAAWEKFSTRIRKGTFELSAAGPSATFEGYEKAPNKFILTMDVPNVGVFQDGFDGTVAWEWSPLTGVEELSDEKLAKARRDAEFNTEVKLRELYPRMKLLGKTKVGDREAYVIWATPREGSPEKMYFDIETGLHIRTDAEKEEEPEGKAIVESYFEDYREVDGILLPFTIRVVSPTGTYSLRFSKVQHDIPIDDAKFSKPTAP